MISSSWAAARTRRQLPQLSSLTVTCNGVAKRWSMGNLHNLEPFKANCPLGMSLSPRARASDRSRRDDRMAPLRLPEQAGCAPLEPVPRGARGKGPWQQAGHAAEGKRCRCKRSSLAAPSHMFPPSPSYATCSQALPFMLICFALQKYSLSSFRSATSCPHAARLNSSSDTPAVLQTPPKAVWLQEDGKQIPQNPPGPQTRNSTSFVTVLMALRKCLKHDRSHHAAPNTSHTAKQ